MKKLLLTAMHSGAGKTVVTCALLAALKRRGIDVCSFKCGPDYIDPMFHTHVLGVPSRNLDLFLQGEEGMKKALLRTPCDLALAEGAMGYYDGIAGTETASAWEIGTRLGMPVVLILRPKGAGVSLAAQIKGMMQFRRNSGIRGLLLTDCTPALAAYLTPILTRETGLAVLGYLPPMPEAQWESRHLGLLTADEIRDLAERVQSLAVQLEQTVQLDALLALAEEEPAASSLTSEEHGALSEGRSRVRIAVARDKAFCFYYEDSLDALREAGAELCFFSPLEAEHLPEAVDGLYLGGGYPELYAERLAGNTNLRTQIRAAVQNGLPTVAECGGFLYLQAMLEDAGGQRWPMCGVFAGTGFRTSRLQRFGYQNLQAETDSLLFRRGEPVPAHEFHYWDCTENGEALVSVRPGGKHWACGYTSETLYAAFPHVHLGGKQPLAARFAEACRSRKHRNLSLVIGGAGSGKSAYAEKKAVEAAQRYGSPLIYLATMRPEGTEAAARIRRHREMRAGLAFQTIECPAALAQLPADKVHGAVVLLEDLGNLLSNELFGRCAPPVEGIASAQKEAGEPGEDPVRAAETAVWQGISHLTAVCRKLVVVTNEIFSDGIAYTGTTAAYQNILGRLNCRLAEQAEDVVEVICGIPRVRKGQDT